MEPDYALHLAEGVAGSAIGGGTMLGVLIKFVVLPRLDKLEKALERVGEIERRVTVVEERKLDKQTFYDHPGSLAHQVPKA